MELRELIERLEKGTGLEPELNRDIALAVIPDAKPREQDCWILVPSEMERDQYQVVLPHPYTLSLDSAMTLVPRGWIVDVQRGFDDDDEFWSKVILVDSFSISRGREPSERREVMAHGPGEPARYICIAALRARAAANQ